MSSPVSRLIRPSAMRVRAPRVPFDLQVVSKTIGTSATYQFSTEDVSRSGLLLVWDRDVRMPFNVNTLLELTIDPNGTCLEKPVSCLGKVMRRDRDDDGGLGRAGTTRLGIQIVQIDNSDLLAWEDCLSELERRFGIEASNKIPAAAS